MVSGDITAEYYTITQRPGDFKFTTDRSDADISELQPYNIYTFSVSSHNHVGSRGKSDLLQIRTGMFYWNCVSSIRMLSSKSGQVCFTGTVLVVQEWSPSNPDRYVLPELC